MSDLVKGLIKRGEYYHYARMVKGKYIRVALNTTCETDAIAKVIERNSSPDITDPETFEVELNAYIKDRVARKHLSPMTAPSRYYVLKSFADNYHIRSIHKVNKELCDRWYEDLKRGNKTATAESYMNWLRAFMNWLKTKNKIAVNPVVGFTFDWVTKKYKHAFVEKEGVEKLINEAPHDELKFILLCGFDAGLRRNEISEARPEWFNLQSKVIHIHNSDTFESKDGDDRVIPLSDRFLEFLQAYGLKAPFMLQPNKVKGKNKYRYDFNKMFKGYMKTQGFSWVTIHTMRHTFASLRVPRAGIFKVAGWLGDGVEVVENHYGQHSRKADPDINV